MDDDERAVRRLGALLDRFPDLSADVAQAVFEANAFDFDASFQQLCEMVAEHDSGASDGPCAPPQELAAREADFATMEAIAAMEAADARAADGGVAPREAPPPQGAWSGRSAGSRLRVGDMVAKYPWADRALVEHLFEDLGDCAELVEHVLLDMYPVDEIDAFVGGAGERSGYVGAAAEPPRRRPRPPNAFAEALRSQDVAEMSRAGCVGESATVAARKREGLRAEISKGRVRRDQLFALASQTRRTDHRDEARRCDSRVQQLSRQLLERIRMSEEYRAGHVDLHGLTVAEALSLVESKLGDEQNRKFRVVTGRGNGSLHGRSVLKPAIMKYLSDREITFSEENNSDGSLLVTTRTSRAAAV